MATHDPATPPRPRVQGPRGGATASERSGGLAPHGWPTPPELLDLVAQQASVELLYVHVPFADELDTPHYLPIYEQLTRTILSTLDDFLSELGCDYGIQRWPADDYAAWIADSPVRPIRPILDIEELTVAAGIYLRRAVTRAVAHPMVRDRIDELNVACAPVAHAAGNDPHRAYARALRRAQQAACDPLARKKQQAIQALEEAIARRAFEFHYQPIVDVTSERVLAHEALCRGTSDPLRFPDVIFGMAERCGYVWELGRALRDILARALLDGEPHAEPGPRPTGPTHPSEDSAPLLFMNVHPADLEDPVFLEQALSGDLAKSAGRVVIELTERAAIEDYKRVKAVFTTLRRHGYRLAIDDLGAGYAGLTALAELEPEFIKFDMALVRDLHLHPIKARLIRRMNEFAHEIGATTISEGVECAEERDALLSAGCAIMQGYFFARPGRTQAEIPPDRFAPAERASGRLSPCQQAANAG